MHRRLYDTDGVEIEGSHQVLDDAVRHKLSAIIVLGDLYVAQLRDGQPYVERYPLLR